MTTLKNYLVLFLSLLSIQASSTDWPVLKKYDSEHIYKIAMPIGGIGTGTVSLGGRGNLQDWEIMGIPAKGYNPGSGRNNSTFFTLYTEINGKKDLRLLEGAVPFYEYEGASGAIATNHGLPTVQRGHIRCCLSFWPGEAQNSSDPCNCKNESF